MLHTAFTELVGCTVPIQLAGMGGVGREAQSMDSLNRVHEQTGVNFLIPFLDPADRVAIETAASKARLVEFFYGDPDRILVEAVHAGGALASWQVGCRDHTRAGRRRGATLTPYEG